MEILDIGGRRLEPDRRKILCPIEIPDRRCGYDRRYDKDRRSGLDRRNPVGFRTIARVDRRAKWPAVCLYCGKAINNDLESYHSVSAYKKKVDFPTSICQNCR